MKAKNHQVEVLYVDIDNIDHDDEEHDLLNYEKLSRDLARERNIGITSDRNITFVALSNGTVVGAGFSSFDQKNYEFDVIVDKEYEGMGIGTMLTEALISHRQDYIDAAPDSSMLISVVSDVMQKILARKGFVVTERSHIGIIMGPGNECEAISLCAPHEGDSAPKV